MSSLPENLKEIGVLIRAGRWPEATATLRKAVAANASSLELKRRLADLLAAQSEFAEAISLYSDMLAARPEDGSLREGLCDIFLAEGRHAEVLDLLVDTPGNGLRRGRALLGLGRQADAAEALRRAWTEERGLPAQRQIWRLLLRATAQSSPDECRELLNQFDPPDFDRADEAIEIAEIALNIARPAIAEIWASRAAGLDPDNPAAWWQLGTAARALGRHDQALSAFLNAHRLLPEIAQIMVFVVAAYFDCGRSGEARPFVDRLSKVGELAAPDSLCCGMAAWRYGDKASAMDFFGRALVGATDDGLIEDTVIGLIGDGASFAEVRPFADALLKKAMANDDALYRHIYRSTYLADWRERETLGPRIAASLDSRVAEGKVDCNMLWAVAGYGFDYASDMKICRRLARQYDLPALTLGRRRAGDKIRIGWLQIATTFHSTMIATRSLVARSDRGRFEVVGYARRDRDIPPGERHHAFQREFRGSFDRFVDLTAMADEEAARHIAADDIDVLIDMQGMNENNSMGVVGRRPARVTALYYGFCHSTGSSRVDYLLSDRTFMKPSFAALGSEKIVYLPGCQLSPTLGDFSPAEMTRRDAGLPEDAVVLCNFNSPWKHDPETYASWMRILKAVPKAVLWLAAWNGTAVENLKQGAAAAGVDPSRIVFAPIADHAVHLKRLGLADLALDGFYNGGGVTTLDTLWAGVPMITALGLVDIAMARMGASILSAAKLPELIVASKQEYEALAIALCKDRERRDRLRRHLVSNRASLPLFDIAAAARHVDRACEMMFENWAAGNPPRDLEVEPMWSPSA